MAEVWTELKTAKNGRNYFKPDEFEEMISQIDFKQISKNKVKYYNCAASFDIETSSFYNDYGEKQANMYIWMLNISGLTCIGRTWEELLNVFDILIETLAINKNNRFVIYIHNAAYEFQFMRLWFKWESVFALAERKVVRAMTVDGIEFRCSYILTNKSLQKVAEDLPDEFNGIAKLTGELNYREIRSSQTPLTEQELQYCINDVLIVTYLIYDKLRTENNIANIPLTATGYVRKAVRKNCLYNKNDFTASLYYKRLMSKLTMTLQDYEMLRYAFQGGFTHACCLHSNMVLENIGSIDFTSAYPAEMIKEKYPMSPFKKCSITSMKQFREMLNCYCCLFDVEFTDIESRVIFEHVISESKCRVCEDALIDNGRVVHASKIVMTITEQDFFIYEKFYKWKSMRIARFRYAYKNYLPTLFVQSVLEFYQKKTELKGVEGMEKEYILSKSLLNSCYGMTVTDVCKVDNIYLGDEWLFEIPDYDELIEKYNNSKTRFINYAWGIWVTAYCRRDLLMSIYYEFKDDYVYSDTDSIKFRHPEKHMQFIERYNNKVRKDIAAAITKHRLPVDAAEPKTIKGEPKHIGFFEYEGAYDKFKTLGAKRYLTETNGRISLTCAGLNAIDGASFISMQPRPFSFFSNRMYIPSDYTGKLTHTYIDEEIDGFKTDKDGNVFRYHERSCVHLEPQDYDLSIGRAYADFLKGVKEIAEN